MGTVPCENDERITAGENLTTHYLHAEELARLFGSLVSLEESTEKVIRNDYVNNIYPISLRIYHNWKVPLLVPKNYVNKNISEITFISSYTAVISNVQQGK
jgi:hypothetical protein